MLSSSLKKKKKKAALICDCINSLSAFILSTMWAPHLKKDIAEQEHGEKEQGWSKHGIPQTGNKQLNESTIKVYKIIHRTKKINLELFCTLYSNRRSERSEKSEMTLAQEAKQKSYFVV